MSKSDFYDQYWNKEGGAPPEDGYAVAERKKYLSKALLGLPPNSPVLDAGCGHGEFSEFLRSLNFEVTGIDISQIAVQKAQTLLPEVQFEVQSLENGLTFEANRFSAIWFTEVLEHLFDVHGALAELNRVLASNGRLVLTTPYHGKVKNLAIALFGFENHYNPYISHIRFFTRKTLEMCLERAGFKIIECRGIGRFWPVWMGFFIVAEKVANPGPPPQIIG